MPKCSTDDYQPYTSLQLSVCRRTHTIKCYRTIIPLRALQWGPILYICVWVCVRVFSACLPVHLALPLHSFLSDSPLKQSIRCFFFPPHWAFFFHQPPSYWPFLSESPSVTIELNALLIRLLVSHLNEPMGRTTLKATSDMSVWIVNAMMFTVLQLMSVKQILSQVFPSSLMLHWELLEPVPYSVLRKVGIEVQHMTWMKLKKSVGAEAISSNSIHVNALRLIQHRVR